MQQQLEQLQQSLEDAEQEHKKTISELEYKFFEEKIRLQKEANRRIADLAGKAHDEAVRYMFTKICVSNFHVKLLSKI